MTAEPNVLVQNEFEVLKQTMALREQIMDVLIDADLAYTFPGNPSLGDLCVEIGQIERSYIDSFKNFRQDYAVMKAANPQAAGSVDRLKVWFKSLDEEMLTVLGALSNDDIASKMIERGWPVPARTQLHIYREALLIYCAKAVMYLNALGKPITTQLVEWIG